MREKTTASLWTPTEMAGQAPPTSQIICPQHKVTALMDIQGSDMFVSPTETILWPSCLETFPNIWQVRQRINVSVTLKLGLFPGSCKQRAKCACSGDRQNFYLFFRPVFSPVINWMMPEFGMNIKDLVSIYDHCMSEIFQVTADSNTPISEVTLSPFCGFGGNVMWE